MTDKVVLSNVAGTYDVTKINENFATISEALNERVLFRDEMSPLNDNMDMNGNRILNLPAPQSPNEPARKADIVDPAVVQDILEQAQAAAGQAQSIVDSIGSVVVDLDAIAEAKTITVDAKNTAVGASNTATGAATTATTKATEAATSASNAAGSATTATTKAGEAATSATNANTAKVAAEAARDLAQTYAQQASQGGGVQVQADWNVVDTTSKAYILNKPALFNGDYNSLTNKPAAVTKTSLGLDQVDNTSDLNKPVSTATQTALNAKEASLGTSGSPTFEFLRGDKTWQNFGTTVRSTPLTGYSAGSNAALSATDTINGAFGKIQGQINARATLAAPQLTGKTKVDAAEFISNSRTSSATHAIDLSAAQESAVTVTAATTFSFTNAPATGRSQVHYIRLTNGGAFTLTWPANSKFPGGSLGTLTSVGVDLLAVKYDNTTSLYWIWAVVKDVK